MTIKLSQLRNHLRECGDEARLFEGPRKYEGHEFAQPPLNVKGRNRLSQQARPGGYDEDLEMQLALQMSLAEADGT